MFRRVRAAIGLSWPTTDREFFLPMPQTGGDGGIRTLGTGFTSTTV